MGRNSKRPWGSRIVCGVWDVCWMLLLIDGLQSLFESWAEYYPSFPGFEMSCRTCQSPVLS